MTSKQTAGFLLPQKKQEKRDKEILLDIERRKVRAFLWLHSSSSSSRSVSLLSNPHFNFHHPGCSSHFCNLFLAHLPSVFPPSSPLPYRPLFLHQHPPLYVSLSLSGPVCSKERGRAVGRTFHRVGSMSSCLRISDHLSPASPKKMVHKSVCVCVCAWRRDKEKGKKNEHL